MVKFTQSSIINIFNCYQRLYILVDKTYTIDQWYIMALNSASDGVLVIKLEASAL